MNACSCLRPALGALVFTALLNPIAAAQVLTAEHLLSRVEISGGPLPNPVSNSVAFVTHDSNSDHALAAFKPSGALCVIAPGAGCAGTDYQGVHDLAWSRDGGYLAFYQGFGRGRELVVARGDEQLSSVMRLPVRGDEARKSALFFPPVWLADGRSLLALEALETGPEPARDHPWSLIAGARVNPLDNHFRDDTLRRILRVNVPEGDVRALTAPMAIRHIAPSPDGRFLLLMVEDQLAEGYFAGDSLVRPRSFLLLDPETGERRRLPFADVSGAEWADRHSLVVQRGSSLLEYSVAQDSLKSVHRFPEDRSVRFIASGRYILAASPRESAEDASEYIIPPPDASLLVVVDRERNTHYEVSLPGDGQEIVALERVPDSGEALVHTRDLQDFSESVLLVDLRTGESAVVFSAPSSISGLRANASGTSASLLTETSLGRLEVLNIDLKRTEFKRVFVLAFNAAAQEFAEPEVIRYTTPGGLARQALLYLPPGSPTEAMPLIVSAYGRQTHNRHVFQPVAQLHAAQGYGYLMPDVFPGRGDIKTSYVEQVPAAISAVKELYGMAGGTGYFGGSLGGLAGLYLLTDTDMIDAAVLRAAPSEFSMSWATGKDRDASLLEYLMSGSSPFDAREAYIDHSPVWRARDISAPVLLLHGDQDAQVPLSQGIAMYQAMRRMGKDAELRVYPSADHSIVRGNRGYYLDLHSQVFRWWESRLKQQSRRTEVRP